MILLDTSPYMRNGDYFPTRLQAQHDAANLLVSAKTAAHPESTLGISAGTELLVSPTPNVGTLLRALHDGLQKPQKTSNVRSAVQVASLALKHRPNKNGAQKIVLFVGTPLETTEDELTKAGRQLKKNNVSIDVVALGELEHNEGLLQKLVAAANGNAGGDSHLVTIPVGVVPSDVLASSPVLADVGGAYAQAAAAANAAAHEGGGDFGDFGGVDPNMDPELAMALRVSMEEERARQERAAAAATEESAPAAAASAADDLASQEDALLQQALAMSMQTDEDEGKQEMEAKTEFQDPAFVQELLGSMPGVDPNDPEIQQALAAAAAEKKDKEEGDKKKE